MTHHRGSEPEQAANCWFPNLSWRTAGFLTVIWAIIISQTWWCDKSPPEIAVAKSCSHTSRAATVAIHAWTKLYTSWIYGVYGCHSCMALTSTTVVTVRRCTDNSLSPTECTSSKSKCPHLKFTIYGSKQANKQTSIYTHMCNAVLLMWGLLRLASIADM